MSDGCMCSSFNVGLEEWWPHFSADWRSSKRLALENRAAVSMGVSASIVQSHSDLHAVSVKSSC